MINHMAQTLASVMLSLIAVGLNLLFVGGAIEWFYPSEVNRFHSARLSAMVSTGVILLSTFYWLSLAISSLSTPITSFQFMGDGLLLSFAALSSYFLVSTQRERLKRTRHLIRY